MKQDSWFKGSILDNAPAHREHGTDAALLLKSVFDGGNELLPLFIDSVMRLEEFAALRLRVNSSSRTCF